MKYIFFGTPQFASLILDKLLEANIPPIALVCNPDRPVGRKKIITPPLTKIIAENYDLSPIQILQPDKLDAEFLEKLKSFNADFFVVAAYAKILKKELLAIPALGVIGVHPSLLPRHRGASPIQSAILSGDEVTGVDLFLLGPGVDDGPVLAEAKCNIAGQNYLELQDKLGRLGGNLLVKTLPDFMTGKIKPIPQNDAKATLTKKFKTEDGFIEYDDLKQAQNGENPAKIAEIERKIRALTPEPGVYTIDAGKRVKLLKAHIEDGKLRLTRIQKEGGKPIEV